jgi:hypothetical protein
MSLLAKAVFILRSGQPLPTDIAARLMAMGIDVGELERRHAL